MTLWTQSTLVAARGIYERAGFRRVAVEPHAAFGVPLEGETWELDLRPARNSGALPDRALPHAKAKPPRKRAPVRNSRR
jgi:hypothetical protein